MYTTRRCPRIVEEQRKDRPFYMAFQGFKLNPDCSRLASVDKIMEVVLSRRVSPILDVYDSLSGEADVFVWMASWSPQSLYTMRIILKSETVKECGTESFFWLSVYKPSPYHPAPTTGEVYERLQRGERLNYLVFYPMKKSPEWYLIPLEERRKIMAEHIAIARRATSRAKGEVRSYTTYTFGLAGWEFIVVYEVEDLAEWVGIVEELRQAEARKWIVLESPVIIGARHK